YWNNMEVMDWLSVDPEGDELFKKARKTAESKRKRVEFHSAVLRCPPSIQFGDYEIDTWYSSPYPQEYAHLNKLYICEYCLTYMIDEEVLARHNKKCEYTRPPADEIYRGKHQLPNGEIEELSVYEVDGTHSKLYCQNLCLLAKLFLDNKTLYYDVEPFLFYVLARNKKNRSHFIGYFSKEKHCAMKNNVSCIMTLPLYQGHGYGRFLIEFSYLLSKHENLIGTPEKPLSDLGRICYNSYWKHTILKYIHDKTEASIEDISTATGITQQDILSALEDNKMLRVNENGQASLVITEDDIKRMHKPRLTVNPDNLKWTPSVNNIESLSLEGVKYIPDDAEELGSSGAQMEQVQEKNSSFIWALIKQIKPGMDLSKVVLPTFILEPRSFLDKLSDYYYHSDLLASAVIIDDPIARMVGVVKWYLSGFYKKPKGAKKPYNPILGECFRCYWENPSNGSRTFFIAEQVSHHPPISAFHVTNRKDGYYLTSSLLTKSKYNGASVSAILDGKASLHFIKRDETYTITMPHANCKGILIGPLCMELGGKVEIVCADTGCRCELEFKLKPMLSGNDSYNMMSGKILSDGKVTHTIDGHWDKRINILDKRYGRSNVLWEVNDQSRQSRLKRCVVALDDQQPNESQKLWQHVTQALKENDQRNATKEKTKLEDAQRMEAKQRGQGPWVVKYFALDTFTNEWRYKWVDTRPWSDAIDIRQFERNFKIRTLVRARAHHHNASFDVTVEEQNTYLKRKLQTSQSESKLDLNNNNSSSILKAERYPSSPHRLSENNVASASNHIMASTTKDDSDSLDGIISVSKDEDHYDPGDSGEGGVKSSNTVDNQTNSVGCKSNTAVAARIQDIDNHLKHNDDQEQQQPSQINSDAPLWHAALDIYYGFDIGELVEVEHEPMKYWLAKIIYTYKNLLLLKWECDYGEFWLNCAQAGGKKRCYPPGHFMQSQFRSQYELKRPPPKPEPSKSPFGNIKTIHDLLLEDDFEDTSGNTTCLGDQQDQLKVTKSAKKRLLQKEDVEELEAALQVLEGLDNDAFDSSENKDTNNDINLMISDHKNSEISTQQQLSNSDDVSCAQTSSLNSDGSSNDDSAATIRSKNKTDLNSDTNSNNNALSVVNTAADPIVLTSSSEASNPNTLSTKGCAQPESIEHATPLKEESAEERQRKEDELNLEKCKVIRQQAIDKLRERSGKLGAKPKQIYDLGGVNPEKVFIPGALLEICHCYGGSSSKNPPPPQDLEPATDVGDSLEKEKGDTNKPNEEQPINLECNESLEKPKSPVPSKHFCHWFAFIVENSGGRLTLRWLLSDEPRFKQGRLEYKSATCSFIEEEPPSTTTNGNSSNLSGSSTKNGSSRPSSGDSGPTLNRMIPARDATFKMHYCHPAIHTIGKAQKLDRVYRIPNKLRERIIAFLSSCDKHDGEETNSNNDPQTIENIEKRLCDSVLDARRINLDKDRPLIDYFLHIIQERRPAHVKKLNDSGDESQNHDQLDHDEAHDDHDHETYNEDSADKQDDINELISESAWCSRIYFNHKCFSGPALSKGKICSLPQYVGPGPLRLVMEEVVSKIISVAYVPPRILNELSGKNFEELLASREITNTSPMMFKAKYQKRVYREELPVILDDSDVTAYCECICEHLKCCYNLFGPYQYSGDDCPGHCRGLTKSNKFMKRAIYYREKARMGEFIPDAKKTPVGASNNSSGGTVKHKNSAKTSRPPYKGRDSQGSSSARDTPTLISTPSHQVVSPQTSDVVGNRNDEDSAQDTNSSNASITDKESQSQEIEMDSQEEPTVVIAGDSSETLNDLRSPDGPLEKKIKLEDANDNCDDQTDVDLADKNTDVITETTERDDCDETIDTPDKEMPTTSDADDTVIQQKQQLTQHEDIFSKDARTIFEQLSHWTVDDVYEYVKSSRFYEFANLLRDQEIDGPAFLLLDLKVLREYFDFHKLSSSNDKQGLSANLSNRLSTSLSTSAVQGTNSPSDLTTNKCTNNKNTDMLDVDELSHFIRKIGEKINLINNDRDVVGYT
ncbi:Oxysterol-binding protein-related protein 5, partial [Fragariocoptes setiger]